jgi:transposase
MADFHWYPHRVDLLRKLSGEGRSARVIAQHFGVTRNAVIGAARRNGVKLLGKPPTGPRGRRRGASDATKIEAVALNLCGYSLSTVSARYSVTIFTICRWKTQPHILQRAQEIATRLGGTAPPRGRPAGRVARPMVLTQAERERRSAWMTKVAQEYWARVRAARQVGA